MTDRPIIFSAPMVRALLGGRKTQTRRLVRDVPARPADDNLKHEPRHHQPYLDSYCSEKKTTANPRGMSRDWAWWTRDDRPGPTFRVPAIPGDRMYVREAWSHTGTGVWTIEDARRAEHCNGHTIYRATDEFDAGTKFWPSIHMPREFSRLTLIVEGVKVERLHDISADDAWAEGVERLDRPAEFSMPWRDYTGRHPGTMGPRECFASLWESLHGGASWTANPFVVAMTFRVVAGNIDRIEA